MTHRRRRAVFLVVLSAILVGLGILLFTIDVGKASQYAGVSSFLVGLLTATMSTVLFARTVHTPADGRQYSESPQSKPKARKTTREPRARSNIRINTDGGTIEMLNTAPGVTMNNRTTVQGTNSASQ